MYHRYSMIALLLLFVLPQCTEPNPEYLEPVRCDEGQSYFQQVLPATQLNMIDVLLVVDNTPGSGQVRDALQEAAPTILESLEGLDYRIGVISMDGTGQLHTPRDSDCGGPWASAEDANPREHLGCLLKIGETGAIPPAGLESIVYALSDFQ